MVLPEKIGNTVYEPGYLERAPGVMPKGKIIYHEIATRRERNEILRHYFEQQISVLYKEPKGAMKFPYLVPGGAYQDLWDWDAFFVACAVPESGLPYAKGAVENFLDGVFRTTGRPAKKIGPDGSREAFSFPYPLQAQFSYIIGERLGDFSWLEQYWNNLKRMRKWFDAHSVSPRGYYLWNKMYGNGLDNNPAVYGRPNRSSAGVDLASWHYRDIMAMAQLAKHFEPTAVSRYYDQAQKLKAQIQQDYWDKIDRFFYNIDCQDDFEFTTCQSITWRTYLKFRKFSCFFPLWAGVATQEQAVCMRDVLMDEKQFLAPCGIRSHSKEDIDVYNNVQMVDPSNWQGPVWGLTSYLCAYGLSRYGFRQEAAEIARRMSNTFANDIQQNGCIHEYYSGEDGQPLFRPGFISWNVLARCAEDEIAAGRDSTTLGLLDE